MPIDIQRIVQAVAERALQSAQPPFPEPKPKKPHLTTPRAVLLGAGLVTAGRALASSRGREMLGSLRDRVAEPGQDRDEDYEDQDYEDDEYQPEADEDEDFDDEDDYDEPEADEEEDFDGEGFEEDEEDPEPPRRRARSGSGSRGRG